MTRCSICKLPPARKEAIDEALRNSQVSLGAIAEAVHISKSSLFRHRQHLRARPDASLRGERGKLPELSDEESVVPYAVSPEGDGNDARQACQPLTREVLLQRLESLWNEAWAGVLECKEPLTIQRDGKSHCLPPDVRGRAAFLREGREILQLQGAAAGNLVAGPTAAIFIVMPETSGQRTDSDCVVDIALPPRRRE